MHVRRTTWAITALQVGAVFFAGGLTLLYLNPFWHFDEHGLLDWRVHWWNGAAAVMIGGGLLIAALALVASAAVLVSRCVGRRLWPYAAAALLALCPVIWIGQSGYVRNLNAGFVWDAADGFSIFNLQSWDQVTGSWRPEGKPALQSLVAMQIEPLLRGYLKLNDWQKMNGNLNIKVTKVIPVVLPVTLGGEELALQDPDQTPLMKAVVAGDLNAVQQLLSDKSSVNINALDQGGETALILACQSPKPKPEIIKALLAAGADVNLRSRTGYTALTWALVRNNNDVSRILRRAGARR
jgi:hypothetical protein